MNIETSALQIKERITDATEIVIIPHRNPDGDAVGSLIGLTLFLKGIGKSVRAISPSPPSERYAFLTGYDLIEVSESIPTTTDLVIYVDSTATDRAFPLQLPTNFKGPIINIDHHEDNSRFGDVNLVIDSASSTAEIIDRKSVV